MSSKTKKNSHSYKKGELKINQWYEVTRKDDTVFYGRYSSNFKSAGNTVYIFTFNNGGIEVIPTTKIKYVKVSDVIPRAASQKGIHLPDNTIGYINRFLTNKNRVALLKKPESIKKSRLSNLYHSLKGRVSNHFSRKSNQPDEGWENYRKKILNIFASRN